jgi:hypothetical protein
LKGWGVLFCIQNVRCTLNTYASAEKRCQINNINVYNVYTAIVSNFMIDVDYCGIYYIFRIKIFFTVPITRVPWSRRNRPSELLQFMPALCGNSYSQCLRSLFCSTYVSLSNIERHFKIKDLLTRLLYVRIVGDAGMVLLLIHW